MLKISDFANFARPQTHVSADNFIFEILIKVRSSYQKKYVVNLNFICQKLTL